MADSLRLAPAVVLLGPRQSGKSTLARAIAEQAPSSRYLTLDSAAVRAAAAGDPDAFARAATPLTVIDEVQLVPALARSIKLAIDENRTPGRFLLTGSARLDATSALADALVGRAHVHHLLPFSLGELSGIQDAFIDRAFAADERWRQPPANAWAPQVALRGGFPEVTAMAEHAAAEPWFTSYTDLILRREVPTHAHLADVTRLRGLLVRLAADASGTLRVSNLSQRTGIPQSTVRRDLALLEGLFLVHRLPAYGRPGTRDLRSPKLHLVDPGLAHHLLELPPTTDAFHRPAGGALLETHVVGELAKQATWSQTRVQLMHWRSAGGQEVDIVLQAADGRVIGVEVKASSSLNVRDGAGLRSLRDHLGERFVRGVILHPGDQALPIGERLWAAPLGWLGVGEPAGA